MAASVASAAATALQPVFAMYTARLASLEVAQSSLIEKLHVVLAEAASVAASSGGSEATSAGESASAATPLLDAAAMRAYASKVEGLIRKQAAIRAALSDSQARLLRIESALAAHEKAHKPAAP